MAVNDGQCNSPIAKETVEAARAIPGAISTLTDNVSGLEGVVGQLAERLKDGLSPETTSDEPSPDKRVVADCPVAESIWELQVRVTAAADRVRNLCERVQL